MLLTSTSDIVRIVTSATADIDIQAGWVDHTATTPFSVAGRTNTKVTSATTTTIVASPAASTQRQVKTLVIRNIHASTANDITVQHYDGTNSVIVYKATLVASGSILYNGTEWIAYDSSGTPISLTAVNLADGDYGDVTIGGSGTTMTIDNNAVTLAKLATQAANTVLANATTGAAVPTAVTVAEQTLVGRITGGNVDDLSATQARTLLNVADGANAYVHPNHSGDVTSVADGAQTIGAKKVTVAMLADGTDGELITWNATGVAATVAVGTATHVLTSNGTGAAPTFQAAPSGGVSVANIGSTAETVGGSVDNGIAATASRSDHKHAITNPAIDTLAAATDITTLNATTSAHGLVVKATAPAAGLMNFVGLTNAETAYTNKPLFDTTNPEATGTAGPGTQVIAARRDHVHAAPTTVTGNAGTVTVADAAADTTTWPLLGTSQTGSLAPATDAGLTYNANTNALSTTTFIGALTGAASGNLTSANIVATITNGVTTNAPSEDAVFDALALKEATANKDATGGYAGLTLFKINFKNAANTFTNFLTNATTAARTYTFQNRDGTIADDTDLALKAPLASPTFTGTVTVPVGLTGVIRADTGVLSVDSDVTDIVAAGSSTAAGKLELATDAETVTGTDTARATTPANITAKMAAPGAIGGTTPAAVTATTITPNTSIILQENAPIILDPALSADGKYSGITMAGTAGAALAFGDLCYLAAADSRWELADSDAEATAGPVKLGICVLAAAGDASATTMLLMGTVRADAAFPAMTISAPLYVGTTAGDIQVAAPSGAADIIRVVGWANTADELYFNPSGDWFEHA